MAEGALQPAELLRFGPFELDPRAGELRKGGERIRLQDQPLQILTMLLAAPGQVVLREEIQRKLWPNHTVVEFDHGINAAVKRLRAALGDSADAPLYIETLARRGYRFIGTVGEDSSQGIQSQRVSNGITDTSDLLGQTVGHYHVVAKLGSGGSGVVYRAEDLKLGRPVALKFLHTASEETPVEVRERFRREARTAATLNHPHICTIYGIEEVEGQQMIVMELLEGETLGDRLAKGPLPIDEALRLGVQLARALDAGHRLGIVHRDFKPANVMLANCGAKILDFGLAKQELRGGAEIEATGMQSLTQSGVVVGTLQYMPPEQLAGKEVDWRCDIWAFGAVLYEMVTGRKAVDGVTHLQPPLLERLVNDCQTKDPLSRKQSLHDVALELEGIAGLPQAGPALIPVAHRTSSARMIWAGIALALLVSGAGILVARREAPRTKAAASPIHLLIDPPSGRSFADAPGIMLVDIDSFALSPDGTKLAAPVMDGDRSRRLWVRSLSSLTGEVLPDTEGASQPFWSPDSKSIGYFAHEKLRVIPALGGPSIPVATTYNYSGGTWNATGTILFGTYGYPISRVPASGGTASPAIPAGERTASLRGAFPWFLPGGRRFLYLQVQGGVSRIFLGDLDSPNCYLLISDALQPAFVLPNYLLFLRAGRLMAQKLNLGEHRVEGEPAIVAGGENAGGSRIETFSVSETGVLVYRSVGPSLDQLAWYNRDGRPSGTVGVPARYQQVFLSPNEKLAAVNMAKDGPMSLWLLHLDNQIPTQLASEAGAMVIDGVWSPDSRRLVYQVLTTTKTRIMTISLSEMTAKLIYEDGVRNYPDDWSPDNKWIIYRREGSAVYIVPPDGKAKPQVLLDEPYLMDQFQFSPDTQWLAYNSMKSGQWEVYVSRFPSMTDTRQVSTAGGCQPIWRKDGRELFYLTEDGKLMAIPVTQGSNLETGAPKELFPTSTRVRCIVSQFAAAQNGDKFLLIEPARPADAAPLREPIHILINWQAALPH